MLKQYPLSDEFRIARAKKDHELFGSPSMKRTRTCLLDLHFLYHIIDFRDVLLSMNADDAQKLVSLTAEFQALSAFHGLRDEACAKKDEINACLRQIQCSGASLIAA